MSLVAGLSAGCQGCVLKNSGEVVGEGMMRHSTLDDLMMRLNKVAAFREAYERECYIWDGPSGKLNQLPKRVWRRVRWVLGWRS